MFEIKKILSVFITIPGIFIFYLIVTGIYGFLKKSRVLKLNLFTGILIYCISISYFPNKIIGLIEKESIYAGKPELDVMILLGGSISEGVPDISGTGMPSCDMMARIVDAARLYKKYKLPIIISGGSAPGENSESSEAFVGKRILVDLGVKSQDIIIEDKSRDTVENAFYTGRIFREKGYKKGLLITSGYHLRRSEYLFTKTGLDVFPHSCGLLAENNEIYSLYDFLPNIGELKKSALALKEAIGLAFYYLKYEIF